MSGRLHIEVTAYHEAGHAVAAMRAGRHVFEARVFRGSPGTGRVRHTGWRPARGYDLMQGRGAARALWTITFHQIIDEIRVCLAGPIAEAKAVGKPLRSLGGRSDFEQSRRAAERLETHWELIGEMAGVPRPKPARILNEQRAYVRRWLARPTVWRLVDRLARRLNDEPALWPSDIARELQCQISPPDQLGLDLGPPVRRTHVERPLPKGRTGFLGVGKLPFYLSHTASPSP